jgi:hypothetical protein
MLKTKFRRFAALLAVVALLTSALGLAIGGTGAYFTATQPGSVSGNIGSVNVGVSGAAINFANLLPGVVQTQTVNFQNTGTGNEDIWIVFDNSNLAWSAVNDLGQYGKFVVAGNTYDNLNNAYAQGTPGSGFMGSPSGTGPCGTVARNAIAYLPHMINLGTYAPAQAGAFNVSFNFIACLSGNGPADLWSSVANDFSPALTGNLPLNFKIAAFQAGVSPSDPFNGAGAVPLLTLPIANRPSATFQ